MLLTPKTKPLTLSLITWTKLIKVNSMLSFRLAKHTLNMLISSDTLWRVKWKTISWNYRLIYIRERQKSCWQAASKRLRHYLFFIKVHNDELNGTINNHIEVRPFLIGRYINDKKVNRKSDTLWTWTNYPFIATG